MKPHRGLDEAAIVRVLWALTAFVVFGIGVGCVWWPSSSAIAQIDAHSREMYDEANSDDEVVRHAAELRALRTHLVEDVRSLSGQTSNGAATAAALRLLSEESKHFRVDVRSVIPQVAPQTTASPGTGDAEALLGTDLSLGLRGHFRNVVAMLTDLPRHDVLLRVSDISLSSSDRARANSPDLDVTVRATLYRLKDRSVLGVTHATGAL